MVKLSISLLTLLAIAGHTNALRAEPALSASQIVLKSYEVLRARHFDNIASKKNGSSITRLFNRTPGRPVTTNSLEAYINNKLSSEQVRSKQLVIFKSGNLKGTGILMTEYHDESRQPSLSIWLPSLRKLRRFASPDYADYWMGTNLTYGDVYFRKPADEHHELVETNRFSDCLEIMNITEEENKYSNQMPEASCKPRGKDIYKIRSISHFENWWYDDRITEIDTRSYVPYRTTFYKDNEPVKQIDVDWYDVEQQGIHKPVISYIYSISFDNKHETLLSVPQQTLEYNNSLPDSFWSERTLRRIKR